MIHFNLELNRSGTFEGGTATLKELKPSLEMAEVFLFIL